MKRRSPWRLLVRLSLAALLAVMTLEVVLRFTPMPAALEAGYVGSAEFLDRETLIAFSDESGELELVTLRADRRARPVPVVVITPGYAEIRTSSGATHLVPNGDWHAKRRTSAMARAASLTFGRPRTRGAVKA